jgi:hypothetical protein
MTNKSSELIWQSCKHKHLRFSTTSGRQIPQVPSGLMATVCAPSSAAASTVYPSATPTPQSWSVHEAIRQNVVLVGRKGHLDPARWLFGTRLFPWTTAKDRPMGCKPACLFSSTLDGPGLHAAQSRPEPGSGKTKMISVPRRPGSLSVQVSDGVTFGVFPSPHLTPPAPSTVLLLVERDGGHGRDGEGDVRPNALHGSDGCT